MGVRRRQTTGALAVLACFVAAAVPAGTAVAHGGDPISCERALAKKKKPKWCAVRSGYGACNPTGPADTGRIVEHYRKVKGDYVFVHSFCEPGTLS